MIYGPKIFEKRARAPWRMINLTISDEKKYFSIIGFSNSLTAIQESQPIVAEDSKMFLTF